MSVGWRDKKDPNLLLSHLNKIRFIDKDGKVKFNYFDYKIITTLIYDIFKFPSNISETDARMMISQSIRNIDISEQISCENLKDELRKSISNFLSQPQKRFVLVSQISISKFIKMKNIYFNNIRIIVEGHLHKRFDTQQRRNLVEFFSNSNMIKIPNDYSFIRIFTSSRSVNDAINQAMQKLNFIRGIWNYILNFSSPNQLTIVGKLKPINKIILGPIYSIQDANGKIISNGLWYDPAYCYPIKPFSPDQKTLNILKKAETNLRQRIKKIPYSNDLESALIRYSNALDEQDMTTAYLKLWGILELLTGATNTTKNEVVARRVASLKKHRNFHTQALMILKDYRNSFVHHGEEMGELEIYLNQLKNYVELLIHFHTTNKFGFKSIAESAEFLDLPVGTDDINYKIRLYNFAKDFRNKMK